MKKSNIKLRMNELTGDYEILHNGFSWVSDGRRPYIILRKKVGNKYISTTGICIQHLKSPLNMMIRKLLHV